MLRILFALSILALAGVSACADVRSSAITTYETFVEILMLDTAKAEHECSLAPSSRECVESVGEFKNAIGWLVAAHAKIRPPLTEQEKKEIHDYVMRSANAARPDWAPMFTEKDYLP
jgi:hypothetical protein